MELLKICQLQSGSIREQIVPWVSRISRSVYFGTGVGFTALEWASRKGHLDIVEWLVTRGGADASVGMPAFWACYTNHVHIAKVTSRLGT